MLDPLEFRQWCQNQELSQSTEKIIISIRTSPPTRRVETRAGNVSGRYPSRKMEVTIQFESLHNELAGIYEMEHNNDVLEYYDQPPAIKLNYPSSQGRNVGVWHTPDFFVIRRDSAGWEEWKTTASLTQLRKKMPFRYELDQRNQWKCPPGEAYANKLGLYYRLRTDKEINWTLINNLKFLEDYLREPLLNVDAATKMKVWTLTTSQPGISLLELIEKGCHLDELYTLIATHQLSIPLTTVSLAENSANIPVFIGGKKQEELTTFNSSPLSSQDNHKRAINLSIGEKVEWNGHSFNLMNIGETHLALLSEEEKLISLPKEVFFNLVKNGQITGAGESLEKANSEKIHELLNRASPSEWEEAHHRYEVIEPYLQGNQLSNSTNIVSERTIRRWLKKWHQAQQKYGYGYLGLLPQIHQKGNRLSKLPQTTQKLIDEFIANDYETLKQKGKSTVYGAVVEACHQKGIPAPSYKTFIQKINARCNYTQTLKRQGSRAAYQHEPFYWQLEQTTPRHGNRPWEIVHLDHTQLDIELISSLTGVNLGRPWATFLTDAYSRRILGIYLSFDPPSKRSCMMVLRECVRRHGRFPQSLVVDGGKEFSSIYFEGLLALYECTLCVRPGGKPRFGSVCERLFGTANTMFIHNLTGNTQITKQPRQITRQNNPKTEAIWTLPSLYQNLCQWAYEFYDNKEHPALGQSPKAAYEMRLNQTGKRLNKLIPYDETFRLLTLPTTPKGTAKVIPNQGIKINHIYYWHNRFREREITGKQVSIRYDPYDMGVAYAYVKGQWLTCISQYYSSFRGHSEREIKAATEELRQQNKRHNQNFTVTAVMLARFLGEVEKQESLLLQRLRDLESKENFSEIKKDDIEEKPSSDNLILLNSYQEEKKNIQSSTATEHDDEQIDPYSEFW